MGGGAADQTVGGTKSTILHLNPTVFSLGLPRHDRRNPRSDLIYRIYRHVFRCSLFVFKSFYRSQISVPILPLGRGFRAAFAVGSLVSPGNCHRLTAYGAEVKGGERKVCWQRGTPVVKQFLVDIKMILRPRKRRCDTSRRSVEHAPAPHPVHGQDPGVLPSGEIHVLDLLWLLSTQRFTFGYRRSHCVELTCSNSNSQVLIHLQQHSSSSRAAAVVRARNAQR